MWTKIFDGFEKKILLDKNMSDVEGTYLSGINNFYSNDNGELLFYSDTRGWMILSEFPSVTLASARIPQFNGTYEYQFDYQTGEAVYYNDTNKYYALAESLTYKYIAPIGFSYVVNWSFSKTKHFDLGGIVEVNESDVVQTVTDDIYIKAYDYDNIYFKESVGNKLIDRLYYVDDATGLISSKLPAIIDMETTINMPQYVSTISIKDEFEGTGENRYVGWLWFMVDSNFPPSYRKDVDIVKDGSQWKLTYNGRVYWGSEPLRDSTLSYSIKEEDQPDPPLPSIDVEFSDYIINAYKDSLSIPNSKEVTCPN